MADADDEVVEEETFPYHTWYSSHSEDEKKREISKVSHSGGENFRWQTFHHLLMQ